MSKYVQGHAVQEPKKFLTLLDLYPDKIGELIVLGIARCPVPVEDCPVPVEDTYDGDES